MKTRHQETSTEKDNSPEELLMFLARGPQKQQINSIFSMKDTPENRDSGKSNKGALSEQQFSGDKSDDKSQPKPFSKSDMEMEVQDRSKEGKSGLVKKGVAANTRFKGTKFDRSKRKIKQELKDLALLGLTRLISNLKKKERSKQAKDTERSHLKEDEANKIASVRSGPEPGPKPTEHPIFNANNKHMADPMNLKYTQQSGVPMLPGQDEYFMQANLLHQHYPQVANPTSALALMKQQHDQYQQQSEAMRAFQHTLMSPFNNFAIPSARLSPTQSPAPPFKFNMTHAAISYYIALANEREQEMKDEGVSNAKPEEKAYQEEAQ